MSNTTEQNTPSTPDLSVVEELTEEQREEINTLVATMCAAGVSQEALHKANTELRERYGIAVGADGSILHVKEDKLRKAAEEGRETGKKVASSIKETFDGTGEAIAYALVDVPVEAARSAKESISSAKETVSTKWEQRKANFRQNHAERLEARRQARLERQREKAAKAEAKRQEQLAKLQEQAESSDHTVAS